MAFIFMLILKKVKNNDMITVLLMAFILIMIGLCDAFKISELLSIMTFGAVVANLSPTLALKSESIIQGFAPIF